MKIYRYPVVTYFLIELSAVVLIFAELIDFINNIYSF
jgi:hypothetical protein